MYILNTHYNTLECEPEEVLRSLGWQNQEISEELLEKTNEAIRIAKETARPKTVLLTSKLDWDDGLSFSGVSLEGETIKEFLHGAQEAALIAATLGINMDRKIKQLERIDLTLALLVDACASLLVEKVLDSLGQDFEQQMAGKFLTERFSPGYSDLPLSLQPQLLNLLDAGRKLGLTTSDSYLLFPRKSVTAFIGIMDKPRKKRSKHCDYCMLRGQCKYGLCAFENKK